MCGFTTIAAANLEAEELAQRLSSMSQSLSHRGPDDDGLVLHTSGQSSIGLAHRRLAIIDPQHGRQPMSTDDGRLCVIFNGAIYNYLELRSALVSKGHPIRTYSDTEVILYAYRQWGDACVDHFVGMFSFLILDRERARLFCARDRIGIKPFYYYHRRGLFIAASEIKAIVASGFVRAESDHDSIKDYLTFQFCLGEKTLFRSVRKLEPGCTLVVDLSQDMRVTSSCYWDISYDIDYHADESWYADNLGNLIEDAIRIHLRSDVPLGAHLSGGLDSSTVVCHAAKMLTGEPVSTFTGAFREGPQFDETEYAREVAKFAGAKYHEIYIDGSEFAGILPKLMYYMDEPLAGPGLVPQYYVSKLASEHVKVVLGGQGGDEIFIGYARYLVAYLEACLAGAIFETADEGRYAVTLDSIIPNLPVLQAYKPMLQGFWRRGLFDASDRRYFSLIDRSEGNRSLFSADVFAGDYDPFHSYQEIFNTPDAKSYINRMTHFDLKGSLPALLHVEDRTSMAVGLESRVPLLDHRILEFMARIPPNIKFSGGRMKHLFKQAIRNTIPDSVLERKDKMGFPTPLTEWTSGVAREFVHDTLLSRRARERGLYNVDAMESAISSEGQFGRVVWGLLCLELWHRIFVDGELSAI
ncbi:MAG: asparagine synthase (glutamine-hydrolyzing) [Pseudomonadales bacterium]